MMILTIFGGQVQKIGNFYPQRFNAKTDWLFFLFVMICETWPWYYRFGCGALFPKSDKKGLDSVSGAQTRQFCLFLAVKCNKLEIFTLKVAKQTLASYPSSL